MPPVVTAAVVTGHHPFEVMAFHQLFRSLDGVDAYIQPLEDFVCTPPEARAAYDTIVFYNMHQPTPGDGGQWYEGNVRAAIETFGQSSQGVFLLHHAILAYPQWPLWSELVGIEDRSFTYHYGETVRSEIAIHDHPITRGLQPWEMVDETYNMADAGEGSEVLITYDHPRSMKSIAWTRLHGNARVFCYEAGHDNSTYSDPNFREVVRRGILWTAGLM